MVDHIFDDFFSVLRFHKLSESIRDIKQILKNFKIFLFEINFLKVSFCQFSINEIFLKINFLKLYFVNSFYEIVFHKIGGQNYQNTTKIIEIKNFYKTFILEKGVNTIPYAIPKKFWIRS